MGVGVGIPGINGGDCICICMTDACDSMSWFRMLDCRSLVTSQKSGPGF